MASEAGGGGKPPSKKCHADHFRVSGDALDDAQHERGSWSTETVADCLSQGQPPPDLKPAEQTGFGFWGWWNCGSEHPTTNPEGSGFWRAGADRSGSALEVGQTARPENRASGGPTRFAEMTGTAVLFQVNLAVSLPSANGLCRGTGLSIHGRRIVRKNLFSQQ